MVVPATEYSNDYYPKVVELDYADMDEIIDRMSGPGSILKKTEIVAVIESFLQELAAVIAEARGFKHKDFTLKIGLRGVANNPEERWDDNEHKKYARILLGNLFQEAANKIELEFVSQVSEAASIQSVYDLKTEETNGTITIDDLIRINGDQLKIYDNVKGQGLFLVSQEDNTEYAVKIDKESNTPSMLLARVPEDLPPGDYTLKIVNTKYYNSSTLRTTLSPIVLTAVKTGA